MKRPADNGMKYLTTQDEKTIDTTYTNNIQSMLGYTYHSAMWTAVKK